MIDDAAYETALQWNINLDRPILMVHVLLAWSSMLHLLAWTRKSSPSALGSVVLGMSPNSKPDTFRYFSEPANVESKCIFCKIGDGRIKPGRRENPGELLFENDNLVVFDDIEPGAKRHMLVVPKKHIKNCWALDSTVLREMDQVADKMLETLNLENDVTRKFFIRPPWNSVYHVHLHVMIGELTDSDWHPRKLGFRSPWFHITPDQVEKESQER